VVHSRNKGKAGELEAYKLLNLWAKPICDHLGVEPLNIHRNLNQSKEGGYDLVGADWLAIEVKRQETVNLPAWWRQTIKQCGPQQTPLLMWRLNRGQWSGRTIANVVIGDHTAPLVVDLRAAELRRWFEWQVYSMCSSSSS
jgi:hypothetical protein